MLISPAFAQAAGDAAQPGIFQSMMPLVLIFGVFYFLLIRPQQKKQKMHREMLGSIRRGDRIVTGGGILGVVTKVVGDGELMVQIADGVKVRVDRGLVSSVISKPEPADKADEESDDEADAEADVIPDADIIEETSAPDTEKAEKTEKTEKKVAKKGGLKKLLKD